LIEYSGGSDNIVNLWRLASFSSAPWMGSGGSIVEDADTDPLVDPPDIKV
jgi:hypothetical protein